MYGQQDIVGYDDIVGLMDQQNPNVQMGLAFPTPGRPSIASLLQRVAPQMVPAAVQAMQPLGVQPGQTVLPQSNRVMREFYLGLGPRVVLPANAAVTTTTNPQLVCRIKRLVIRAATPATPDDFVVTEVNVGNIRQINGDAELPGALFAADGYQLDLQTSTVNIGNTVTVRLQNLTANPITIALGAIAWTLAP